MLKIGTFKFFESKNVSCIKALFNVFTGGFQVAVLLVVVDFYWSKLLNEHYIMNKMHNLLSMTEYCTYISNSCNRLTFLSNKIS